MSYDESHNENMCDRCLKDVGRHNLWPLPFLYCDKNDTMHEDKSQLVGLPYGEGYKQYFLCEDCKIIEDRISFQKTGKVIDPAYRKKYREWLTDRIKMCEEEFEDEREEE